MQDFRHDRIVRNVWEEIGVVLGVKQRRFQTQKNPFARAFCSIIKDFLNKCITSV